MCGAAVSAATNELMKFTNWCVLCFKALVMIEPMVLFADCSLYCQNCFPEALVKLFQASSNIGWITELTSTTTSSTCRVPATVLSRLSVWFVAYSKQLVVGVAMLPLRIGQKQCLSTSKP